MAVVGWVAFGILLLVCVVALYDVLQRRHSILRTFPVIGHLRFLLEDVGPELRQYIVTGNDEERPFSRDQRRWVYATAKRANASFGFGTDNDLELSANYLIVKPAVFPLPAPAPDDDRLECRKVLGAARGRARAFRPASVVNISGMSFGALSAPAVAALNKGAAIAGCLHNTGEGGISEHHLHGGDLVFQIGTGYFGCRTPDGRFSLERLVELVDRHPIRAVEIKLSQGAKPGLGGVLPAAKVTPEIARIRGVPAGQTCVSPSTHSAFSDVDSLLDTVEEIAAATGLPVGIKSAVGELGFWEDLANRMVTTGRGVDFITIDGGEGGTGAAPLAFSDHVALPFKLGFSRVHAIFATAGLDERTVFVGSAKLGFPETALLAMAMGCDLVNVGREAMLALGCIQAQRCHTGHCPTGVATQSRWLTRGLDPQDKAARVANYVSGLRHDLLRLAHACAVSHPALVTLGSFEILDGHFGSRPASEVFDTTGARGPKKPDGRVV
ncbi:MULTISPECIES: FMN-binding glutamate synthase family protein [unclassified Frankia]|uniref:FMN-binding glutamate synthase family protein n=1 Tax=unclassified Frankia TaxID=2632575 RepID=UPI0020242159